MVTRTYRLDHDLGFAPNPYFGWCTLACCMPQIRKHASPGDVIVGVAGSGANGLGRIHPQLIYWMLVDEALTFDQYWYDPRFTRKRPRISGPKMHAVGDRTYRHEPGDANWSYEPSMHYVPDAPQGVGGHVAKDTKVDRLLVGQTFTYWGGTGPVVPAHLLHLFPNPRGQKCPPPGPALDELHNLMSLHVPQWLAGEPADWNTSRYFRR